MREIYDFITTVIGVSVKTLLLGMVWFHFYNPIIRIPFWTKGHYFILTLYFLMLFYLSGNRGKEKRECLKWTDILFSQISAIFIADVIFYLEICLLAYRFPTAWPIVVAAGAAALFEIAWSGFLRIIERKLFPPYEAVLVYGKGTGEEAVEKLGSRRDKFVVKSKIDAKREMEEVLRVVDESEVVLLWNVEAYRRSKILKYCFERNKRIYILPSVADIILSGTEEMYFFDVPLFLKRGNALGLGQLAAKRVFDIVLAAVALALASPVMAAAAVAIKLYDRGPVLYRQIRCTKDGKQFLIYKFRSMIENAERDGIARLSSKRDDRITPVGVFIRKTRIDELPQLLNVLRGDMSFIGPRPERPEIIEEYRQVFPEFAFRMKMKAGLTGYAQIYGKYNTTPYNKLKLDLFYIEHYSIWLDIKILLQTVKVIFTPESTEGIEEGQKTSLDWGGEQEDDRKSD